MDIVSLKTPAFQNNLVWPFMPQSPQATPRETGEEDSAEFSPWGDFMSRSGLDPDQSWVSRTREELTFELNFQSQEFASLSASGLYASQSRQLDLSFSYSFQQEVVVDGKSFMKTFEANFSLSVSHFQEASLSPYSKKEDIMDMVRRLLESIRDTVADDDKKLGGVILDKEDVRDLAAIEDGKFLKEITSLVNMIVMQTRIMEFIKGESEGDAVVLYPQRKEEEGITYEQNEMTVEDFQMEIIETGMTELPRELVGEDEAEAEISPEKSHSPMSWIA